MVLLAGQNAGAGGAELRLALSRPGVLRGMELLGAGRALPVSFGLNEAPAGGDRR